MTKIVNPNDQISALKSMLTSAIIKGLDMVGIVSPSSPAADESLLQGISDNK
jgi:hypothetical protein